MGTRKSFRRSWSEPFIRIWRDPEKLFYATTIVGCSITISIVLATRIAAQLEVSADERLLAELQAYKLKLDAQNEELLEERAMGPELIGYYEAAGTTWAIYHRPKAAVECPAEPLAFHRGCVEEVSRLVEARPIVGAPSHGPPR